MQVKEQVARVLQAQVGHMRPIYAHYGVTHRCNMRCRMCEVWKSANPVTELTPPQVDHMACQLHQAGIRMIALGGGEPFIRHDIADLVRHFSARAIDVRLLTNGIGVSDDQINAVVDAGVTHVSISLDTLDPEKEKQIYGGHDVWSHIVDSMRRFRNQMAARPGVPVMNVCVSRLNIDELPALVEFAAGEGYFCSFIPIALAPAPDAGDGFAAYAPDMALTDADMPRMRESYDRLLALKRHGAPIANTSRFLHDSVRYFTTGTCRWSCDAGRLYLSISPEGALSMCHHYPSFAHHDTEDLANLLQQATIQTAMAGQRRACPGCIRPCWAEVTHAMRHLPSAWEAYRTLRLARHHDRSVSAIRSSSPANSPRF